jgi:hypothetical protein
MESIHNWNCTWAVFRILVVCAPVGPPSLIILYTYYDIKPYFPPAGCVAHVPPLLPPARPSPPAHLLGPAVIYSYL